MRILRGLGAALSHVRDRGFAFVEDEVYQSVVDTIERVRSGGDRALFELTERYDGVRLDSLGVPPERIATAADRIDAPLRRAIDLSIERVDAFYRLQPAGGFVQQSDDALLGLLVRPLDRVGCYVPGFTAPLFSSLIMTAVPARVAGVADIAVATPPRRDGTVPDEILYVAHALGIERVYRLGGAQAIAALAYGSDSVTAVDKIVGPGNRYVVMAKRAVFGRVGIESLPGPTETLVLADDSANPLHVAADLLAQAEHHGAQPVLVTTSSELLDALPAELERLLSDLPTAETARESLEQRGFAALLDSLDEALELVNAYAPEHLCLLVADPWALVPAVRNAGGIFVGALSMEALGDYLLGPSHVMPTGGTARHASLVNLRDFQKVIPLLGVGARLLPAIGPAAAIMARAEGLEAHARAIETRLAEANREATATPTPDEG